MSPLVSDYFRYTWQLFFGSRSYGEGWLAQQRKQDILDYLQQPPWKILDLANGRLRPQYTILRAAGHRVYGIDLVNRPAASGIDFAYRIARQLYTWRLGLPSRFAQADGLICGNVNTLPFPDQYFDLVISMAALEHFLDVPAVVKEIQRVLCPGGIVWVGIHPFTCPTGGHNVSFTQFPLRTLPRGVEPWDHLRKQQLPFTVPLNQWRIAQYVQVFTERFEVLKTYCASSEGEQFLTSTANYVIVARKALAI